MTRAALDFAPTDARGNMTRLDILHLVTRSQRRGAELVALELARQLDALGHDNRVVALGLGFDGSIEDDLPPLVRQRGSGAIAFFASVRALRRDLNTRPVDVVLAHGGRPFEVAVLARRGSSPLVVWQRILPFPSALWRRPRRWRWQRAARAGDAAVVLSSDLDVELRRLGFRGPIWTIPNFRDPERFSQVDRRSASVELRSELGVDVDARLIGLVGHLIEQKRPERALDVLAEVHALGERAHLVVAGDGPLRAELERDASDRGLAAHVHFLGERRDIERVIGGIDVLVLTSDAEGVPGVLIEALMVGCPAVTVRVGGVATIVEDGKTGFLIDNANSAAMAERVVCLLRDPELRSKFGLEARRRSAGFSSRAAALTYAARFESLLGGVEPHTTPLPE